MGHLIAHCLQGKTHVTSAIYILQLSRLAQDNEIDSLSTMQLKLSQRLIDYLGNIFTQFVNSIDSLQLSFHIV
jgi:hypothetical protein